MNIGEKIKRARKAQHLTQADISGNKITRNMLSAIENGKATPSLDTLQYIAEVLDVPVAYLVSNDDNLFAYRKRDRMPAIKSALETSNYSACISLIMKLESLDDELYFILAKCYYELGVTAARNGALESAKKRLVLASDYCNKTMYDTSRFQCAIPLYLSIAKNINAPLLEFDEKEFSLLFSQSFDYEFYKYLTLDFDFKFTDRRLKAHMEAKLLIKERKYADALELLLKIEESKNEYTYNAYIMYGIYADIESCYRQLYDFESAYRFASKRLSLVESFHS